MTKVHALTSPYDLYLVAGVVDGKRDNAVIQIRACLVRNLMIDHSRMAAALGVDYVEPDSVEDVL